MFYNQMAIYPRATIGMVLHELMHVLGFEHEHQRAVRDQFVTIKWPRNPLRLYHEWHNGIR